MALQIVRRRMGWWLLIPTVVIALVALLLQPWHSSTITSQRSPAQSYAEAIARIDKLRVQESAPMNPLCRLQFMTHNQAVERAIVLVHGYTNCPQQFKALGEQFYTLGYNVLIAPLPHHGLADRMNVAQGELTAEELTAYADEVVDIAQGLGTHVTMLGFSMGGVTTAWAAQHRPDLDRAIIMSPAFGFKAIPVILTAPMMNIVGFLPDSYSWWDAERQDKGDPSYAYPRYSRRALGQTLRLGFAVEAAAQRTLPATREIIVVLNENEPSVNNERTRNIVAIWQNQGANVTIDTFAADMRLGHDLIDPNQPDQQVESVYPRIIALVTR